MPAIQMRVHAWLAAASSLCLMTAPASAQQSWLPVITSAEASPLSVPGMHIAGPDLEQGWFPVVIRPPEAEPDEKSSISDHRLVEAKKSLPAAEQRQAQNAAKVQPSPMPVQPPEQPKKPAEARPKEPGLADDYCTNIGDAAADARFAWQKRTLSEMEKELEQRIVILETKTAEYREWLARRDAFVKKAQESLVRIYARMRPDAAAAQLAAVDEETAAAVLTKLNPRNASAILNEMPPARAARLTTTIAGAAKVNPEQNPASGSGGGRT